MLLLSQGPEDGENVRHPYGYMSVKDKEVEDERAAALPHNDRLYISQTELVTTDSTFVLLFFVHFVVTLTLKFQTDI